MLDVENALVTHGIVASAPNKQEASNLLTARTSLPVQDTMLLFCSVENNLRHKTAAVKRQRLQPTATKSQAASILYSTSDHGNIVLCHLHFRCENTHLCVSRRYVTPSQTLPNQQAVMRQCTAVRKHNNKTISMKMLSKLMHIIMHQNDLHMHIYQGIRPRISVVVADRHRPWQLDKQQRIQHNSDSCGLYGTACDRHDRLNWFPAHHAHAYM